MTKEDVYSRDYWAARNSFMEAFAIAKENAENYGQNSADELAFADLHRAMKLLDFTFHKLIMARGNMLAEGVSFNHLYAQE